MEAEMEDSAPLLPPYAGFAVGGGPHSPSSSHQIPKTGGAIRSIDDAIESYIGSGSAAAQLLPAALTAFAWVFDAQQTFINVFTDAMPPWHCITAACSSSSSSSPPCGVPSDSWSWSLPRRTSTISDWSLQCSSPVLLALPSSSYFFGCLTGGLLLATLADSRLGRKNMLVLSSLSMSLSAALTAASPSLIVYSGLRFICGFGRATVGTSTLVLSTELVSRRWRDRVGILGFLCFTMGFLSLPAIAFLTRGSSWRTLYLYTSLPCFLYSILIYLFITESPRWLLLRGRTTEAIASIKSITLAGGDNLISSSFSNLTFLQLSPEDQEQSENIFSALTKLWENRWAFRRLAALMMVSLGVGMVYYGMPLNLGNLSSDLYLSVALNAMTELPSILLVFFLIGRMNRRNSTLAFTAASGACSLACAAASIGGWVEVVAELGAFFSACTAFSFVLIYSIELFPTCVRNSAIAMVRQAVVLGGVFAPVLVAAGRRRRVLSFGVFGLVIACCGVFAACLPETRGAAMSDTMEEEEHKLNNVVNHA